MGIITLEIDGVSTYFMSIHYVKNHPSSDPDTFELVLTPDDVGATDYFSQVVIKKDGVTEFVGFVEEISPDIGEGGLDYTITGRCWKLILWKKWTERFQESRDVGPDDDSSGTNIAESGFFGSVYPSELIKLLLRCPTSTTPQGQVRQKIGWGISSDMWTCCASPTADGYDPQWVALRYPELCWRSSGAMAVDNFSSLICNSFDNTYHDWNTIGASPWLDVDDDATGEINTKYTQWTVKEGCFLFQTLDPSATNVTSVYLKLKHRCDFYLDPDYAKTFLWDGAIWHDLGYMHFNYHWTLFTIDVGGILDTPAKINAAKIYFEVYGSWTMTDSGLEITYASLEVLWSVGDPTQKTGNYFIVDLGGAYEVTGILVECRNNEFDYAKNYTIKYSTIKTGCCSLNESDWHDFDDLGSPIDITNNTARDILHSWTPQKDVECIRIKLTASADQPWEISQIYVWQADDSRFRVLNE